MCALRAAQRPDPELDTQGRQAQAEQSRKALQVILDGMDAPPDPGLAARLAAKMGAPVERVEKLLDEGWEPPEALTR